MALPERCGVMLMPYVQHLEIRYMVNGYTKQMVAIPWDELEQLHESADEDAPYVVIDNH